jgi:acetyl esterase
MSVRAPSLSRVPVWVWRALMAHLGPRELRRFNLLPITSVSYTFDVDYVGDGARDHRLDVLVPQGASGPLPVYVYFHGGGWTSGDKSPLTRYCARQAEGGMVVVNVNYRRAPRHRMADMIEDGNAALAWVRKSIADFGGDPSRVVLGGDSAGGQLAALLAATTTRDDLATHYGIRPALDHVSGVVQHCGALDFSVMFERGFILSTSFVRMLLPLGHARGELRDAARFLSPIEWVDASYPPVLVTTSLPDPFYRASLNFAEALREHEVPVEVHVDERAQHTWQQDSHDPRSQPVYERLQAFVAQVASPAQLAV